MGLKFRNMCSSLARYSYKSFNELNEIQNYVLFSIEYEKNDVYNLIYILAALEYKDVLA